MLKSFLATLLFFAVVFLMIVNPVFGALMIGLSVFCIFWFIFSVLIENWE